MTQRVRKSMVLWIILSTLVHSGCVTFPYYSEQHKNVLDGSEALLHCWGPGP